MKIRNCRIRKRIEMKNTFSITRSVKSFYHIKSILDFSSGGRPRIPSSIRGTIAAWCIAMKNRVRSAAHRKTNTFPLVHPRVSRYTAHSDFLKHTESANNPPANHVPSARTRATKAARQVFAFFRDNKCCVVIVKLYPHFVSSLSRDHRIIVVWKWTRNINPTGSLCIFNHREEIIGCFNSIVEFWVRILIRFEYRYHRNDKSDHLCIYVVGYVNSDYG